MDLIIIKLCMPLFNLQAIEYSDDEEEAKAKASKKKERYMYKD